jgi:putative RNA 2'-phosphotransferase
MRAGAMTREGYHFHRLANGVWLTDHVPPRFLFVPEGTSL